MTTVIPSERRESVVIPSERSESRDQHLGFLAGRAEAAELTPGAAISPPDHQNHFGVVDGEEPRAGASSATRQGVLRALREKLSAAMVIA